MLSVTRCREFVRDTMGLCLGCCPRDSGDESPDNDGDRSRLINGEVLPGETSSSWNPQASDYDNENVPNGSLDDSHVGSGIHFSSSLPKTKKTEEQAALSDIVHHMATNIIDVNTAHSTHTLEPSELQERAHEYGRKLASVSAKLANKYSHLRLSASSGLKDAGHQADTLIASDILATSDKMLINEVAVRAREAAFEFQVEPVPNLVQVFGNNANNHEEPRDDNDEDEEVSQQNSEEDEDDESS